MDRRYAAAVILSSSMITYVLHPTHFYEMFWLPYKTVLEHSLL
jgi:hypothetical protein